MLQSVLAVPLTSIPTHPSEVDPFLVIYTVVEPVPPLEEHDIDLELESVTNQLLS